MYIISVITTSPFYSRTHLFTHPPPPPDTGSQCWSAFSEMIKVYLLSKGWVPTANWCTIKIFRGAGVVIPSKPPPPYEQLLPLPTPYFKKFLERSLSDPHPPTPHFKHLSLLPPTPTTTPSPPKNFDHTPGHFQLFLSYSFYRQSI